MDRGVFDEIYADSTGEGQLFLLNLADSIELDLVDVTVMQDYSTWLNSVADRSRPGWWKGRLGSVLPATKKPSLSGKERLVTVAAIKKDEYEKYTSKARLYGAISSIPSRVAAEVLTSRQGKIYYWITEKSALRAATTPDEVRDALGLDWVGQESVLFQFDLDGSAVSKADTKRPSGLCGGSARFRARRADETSPKTHDGWGRTVHLESWRKGRDHASLSASGAPELISLVGPLPVGGTNVTLIGETASPSGCSAVSDHNLFAIALNSGSRLDAETLFKRLP
jgi:hypothetical protein